MLAPVGGCARVAAASTYTFPLLGWSWPEGSLILALQRRQATTESECLPRNGAPVAPAAVEPPAWPRRR